MCGIAGIISLDDTAVRAGLPRLTGALRHRGPDDTGVEFTRLGTFHLGLGHTRLSILDLSARGHQPMVHPGTGDRLIFNGEIYNHAALRKELEGLGAQFLGHGDSEVLLHALVQWGRACLPRLQGMFAFAFHDVHGQRLLLARDSIGIKPLYLAELPAGGLVFASEVRAILETGLVPRRVDARGVAGMLAYGAVQRPTTIFRGITDVGPGQLQVVSVKDESLRHSRETFWRPPPVRHDLTMSATVSRYVGNIQSSGCRARVAPTWAASCP